MEAHYIKFSSLPTWERLQLCILEWYQLKLNKKDLYSFDSFTLKPQEGILSFEEDIFEKNNNVKNVYLIQGGQCQRKQWEVGALFFLKWHLGWIPWHLKWWLAIFHFTVEMSNQCMSEIYVKIFLLSFIPSAILLHAYVILLTTFLSR